MIAVKLEGRLGNQLFQYAFIYAAAKKLQTNFYLDKSVDYLLLNKYFNIEDDFCNGLDSHIFSIKGYKNIFSHYARWLFYYLLKNLLFLRNEMFSNYESPASQLHKIRNNCLYTGYFQSEEYFLSYKDDIKRLFTIQNIYTKKFETIFLSLPKNLKYIIVHVRRGDYIAERVALNTDYYHKAINSIHHEDNYYVFISDDIAFVKTEFGYLDNKYISENDEITDFQFLINADICILSNSSFSWWGAWLNNKTEKKVIAPEFWLGQNTAHEYPKGVFMKEWTLINAESYAG
ncbi:alpha-1,2-fucosyltransferase [Mucilaginibacter sp.]|uniref:alpha-1,2-fucosyltransferase n=1 Tax=Mucilaginibacter sp. TaxID=1882438 RepID=UPI0026192EB3|nr:alpha-1,2-fucosyltransferase [Mucilaginibacter sp.]MDB4926961.1 hypothetical protein [Mucilaginibacter sp.]